MTVPNIESYVYNGLSAVKYRDIMQTIARAKVAYRIEHNLSSDSRTRVSATWEQLGDLYVRDASQIDNVYTSIRTRRQTTFVRKMPDDVYNWIMTPDDDAHDWVWEELGITKPPKAVEVRESILGALAEEGIEEPAIVDDHGYDDEDRRLERWAAMNRTVLHKTDTGFEITASFLRRLVEARRAWKGSGRGWLLPFIKESGGDNTTLYEIHLRLFKNTKYVYAWMKLIPRDALDWITFPFVVPPREKEPTIPAYHHDWSSASLLRMVAIPTTVEDAAASIFGSDHEEKEPNAPWADELVEDERVPFVEGNLHWKDHHDQMMGLKLNVDAIDDNVAELLVEIRRGNDLIIETNQALACMIKLWEK